MKQYEYKFVKFAIKPGFRYDEKVKQLERLWNELGKQGWRFCKDGYDFTIFMREIAESE